MNFYKFFLLQNRCVFVLNTRWCFWKKFYLGIHNSKTPSYSASKDEKKNHNGE